MIQRRVVVTAKQCEENFKPMEILFTRELLTKHIYNRAAGSFARQRSMRVDFTSDVSGSRISGGGFQGEHIILSTIRRCTLCLSP